MYVSIDYEFLRETRIFLRIITSPPPNIAMQRNRVQKHAQKFTSLVQRRLSR